MFLYFGDLGLTGCEIQNRGGQNIKQKIQLPSIKSSMIYNNMSPVPNLISFLALLYFGTNLGLTGGQVQN